MDLLHLRVECLCLRLHVFVSLFLVFGDTMPLLSDYHTNVFIGLPISFVAMRCCRHVFYTELGTQHCEQLGRELYSTGHWDILWHAIRNYSGIE